MNWFKDHDFHWQWFTPVSWPWIYYNRDREFYNEGVSNHYDIITLCIGPIQMRWYK